MSLTLTRKQSIAFHAARIDALADAYGNHDTLTAEHAARNLASASPAYWHVTADALNGIAQLVAYANRYGGILPAVTQFGMEAAERGQEPRLWLRETWLDKIVPLNSAAVADLAEAYSAASSFRLSDELIERTERAERRVALARAVA